MFGKIGLLPIFAAAALSLAGCEGADEAPANDTAPAEANAAQSTAAAGEGAPTGGVCGTIADIQCASAADFCQMPTGQCGIPDAQGTCTTRPEICTKEYVPVCGCDGQTYGNACAAAQAGVNVQSEGACPPNGDQGENATTAE